MAYLVFTGFGYGADNSQDRANLSILSKNQQR